jgi:hypothetical protein
MKDSNPPKELKAFDISHWFPVKIDGIQSLQSSLLQFISKRLTFNPKITCSTVSNEFKEIFRLAHAPSDHFDAIRSFIITHGTDHIWCLTRGGIPSRKTTFRRLIGFEKSFPDHVEGFVTLKALMKELSDHLLGIGRSSFSLGVCKIDIRQLFGVPFHDLGSSYFWQTSNV